MGPWERTLDGVRMRSGTGAAASLRLPAQRGSSGCIAARTVPIGTLAGELTRSLHARKTAGTRRDETPYLSTDRNTPSHHRILQEHA